MVRNEVLVLYNLIQSKYIYIYIFVDQKLNGCPEKYRYFLRTRFFPRLNRTCARMIFIAFGKLRVMRSKNIKY